PPDQTHGLHDDYDIRKRTDADAKWIVKHRSERLPVKHAANLPRSPRLEDPFKSIDGSPEQVDIRVPHEDNAQNAGGTHEYRCLFPGLAPSIIRDREDPREATQDGTPRPAYAHGKETQESKSQQDDTENGLPLERIA